MIENFCITIDCFLNIFLIIFFYLLFRYFLSVATNFSLLSNANLMTTTISVYTFFFLIC